MGWIQEGPLWLALARLFYFDAAFYWVVLAGLELWYEIHLPPFLSAWIGGIDILFLF